MAAPTVAISIQIDEFCINHDEFCISNDELNAKTYRLQNADFVEAQGREIVARNAAGVLGEIGLMHKCCTGVALRAM